MARKKQKISNPKNNTFAIVVDGKTEGWYFQMLKRNEPDLQVNIEPKIPQKKKLTDQFDKVMELAEDYTKVFWIIDLDQYIKEARENPGKIEDLKNYLTQAGQKDNVITILNNPCLEFWFLLHFENTSKYYPQCNAAVKQLKKYLPQYEKTRDYYTKPNNDIYLQLKNNLKDALKRAAKIQRNNVNYQQAICEMNLFFDEQFIKIVWDT